MRLTVATVKQPTWVNLKSLKSCLDENKRSAKNCDCELNEIVIHCSEADHNFSWDQKKVVDRESRFMTKFPTPFLKYVFLIYTVLSYLLILQWWILTNKTNANPSLLLR